MCGHSILIDDRQLDKRTLQISASLCFFRADRVGEERFIESTVINLLDVIIFKRKRFAVFDQFV